MVRRKKLTKAQYRLLRQTHEKDAELWLDNATDIQRAMLWKLERRGYLYIRRDCILGNNYGVIDTYCIITLTEKGWGIVYP